MSGANPPPLKKRVSLDGPTSGDRAGLGTAQLGELFDKIEEDEAAAMIGAAWDRRRAYFDTSHGMARTAEHRSPAALSQRVIQYFISTKVGRVLRRTLGPNAIKEHG